MAVVTVSRQLGSFGGKVARLAARELGYALVDKDLIEGVVRQYGVTMLNQFYNEPARIRDMFNSHAIETVTMFNQAIQAFGQLDNVVIVGRAGFAVIGDYADVLDVRVEAPAEVRAQRILERDGLESLELAAKHVAREDKVRATFVQRFDLRDPENPKSFDLVLDTNEVTVEQAAAAIVDAVRALPGGAVPSVTTAPVDPVLAEAVGSALAARTNQA
ncbi:MAG: cytidylate kinase-like family protein [Micropruina sp.]